MAVKKLIEVALPLDKINEASAREKSIRHGHPSTLHLWWARRPLAAARAVIFASIIDDPSSHPEKFPTEVEQARERDRLFSIINELVLWENTSNDEMLDKARKEILKATNNNPPALLDPFAGGGTIPMEAQRLGLAAYAHDLNPVAVMINKASIEIPPKFNNLKPVNPESNRMHLSNNGWHGLSGMIDDVIYYGKWIKEKAFSEIGYMYPQIKVPEGQGGGKTNAVAWIWTRTVKCPNPACGCEMPLANSFILSKKKGNEAYVDPVFDYSSKKISYKVRMGGSKPKIEPKLGRGANFRCIMCGETATPDYIKNEASSGRMGSVLIGVIGEGKKGRVFVTPDEEQISAANVAKPDQFPTGKLSDDRRALWTPIYGLDTFDKLFSNRQLTTMTVLSRLVSDVIPVIERDAIAAGMRDDHVSLNKGGTGAKAYSEAIAVYLSFAVDREANYCSTQNGWSGDFIIQVFGRQGIPMVWDYAESNPFSNSTGNFEGAIKWVADAMTSLPANIPGVAEQHDAQTDCGLRNVIVSTDPPYYDNIGYADLSDYFYIWMRSSLKAIYPQLFSTMLVPKAEELVAVPYRFNGNSEAAKEFFEEGMLATCKQIYNYADGSYPITIYYAYKQNNSKENGAESKKTSDGWETMLTSIIKANLMITGTWPIHTERETGLKAHVNALASSIVLVCRKRPEKAPVTTRRNLITELRKELRPELKRLQDSNIAPVDLAQAAIGPGMSVFSKYSQVLEADGTPMTVRSAQQIINEEVDAYFNERVGNMDSESRFCVDLYTQFAYNDVKYGEAEVLANAKGVSIATMASHGALYAKAGIVHLVERKDLPTNVSNTESNVWLLTQQLTYTMEKTGIDGCAKIVASMFGGNAENAKDMAYRLYTIAEQKKWTNEAYAYNALVVAWPDIQMKAADIQKETPQQMSIFDYMDSNDQ
jgi:putative DNA methylase